MRGARILCRGVLAMGLFPCLVANAARGDCPDLDRITVTGEGSPADGESWAPRLSADGNTLAFISEAWNLVPTRRPAREVFLFDRPGGSFTRVTKSTLGNSPNISDAESLRWMSLSADGEHIVFTSDATNMVAGDGTDTIVDGYVWHRSTDTIEKVNWSHAGGTANDDVEWPSISGDGRYVVFESKATNLVPGDADDNFSDIFLWDGNSKSIRKLTQTSDGPTANGTSRQPNISADGSTVAFITNATNLVSGIDFGYAYVLWDAATEEFELVAPQAIVAQGKALAISADGGSIAFMSGATYNPEDDRAEGNMIYHWDRASKTYTLVTQSLGPWVDPHGSATIWFRDSDSVLVPYPDIIRESFVLWVDVGQTAAYVEGTDYTLTSDGELLTVHRVPEGSIPAGGVAQASFHIQKYGADGSSWDPGVSPDGRFVSFASHANNMVEGDGHGGSEPGPPGVADAFVWDRDTGELEKLTWNTAGGEADGYTTEAKLSAGAVFAAVTSDASDLVPADVADDISDVFLGTPCSAVPEPSLGLLRAAALLGLAGTRLSLRYRRRAWRRS